MLAFGQSGADPGICLVSVFWLIRFAIMTQPTDRPRGDTDTGPSNREEDTDRRRSEDICRRQFPPLNVENA